ncbi:type II toxin-antitoxin system HipA family toxin [Coraliomargarita akajimensis]|nr:type II toxin-antitoxin system HipA family toxin [Coraliomargarita akajimensis]
MLHGRRVGQLLAQDGIHYFEYDVLFQRSPLPISPLMLPVTAGVSEHRKGHLLSLPGVIADSLPDRFGLSVVRQAFEEAGKPSPSPLEILAYLGTRTMGALTYEPPEGGTDQSQAIDLIAAARSSKTLLEREHGPQLNPALITAGATAGGMMPKLLAAINEDRSSILTGSDQIPSGHSPWLIKLNANRLQTNSLCHWEAAYFELAREAGIRVPDTMLLPDAAGVEHFAVKRFDREASDPNQRIHQHTFSGIMEIDMADPFQDYETLLRLTWRLTNSMESVSEQFRRMVFNLLASVRDDHAKNFSFQMNQDGHWSLSPAYDLNYSENEYQGNWLLIAERRNRITYSHLRKLSDLFSLPTSVLDSAIDDIRTAFGQWGKIAKRNKMGDGLSATILNAHRKQIEELKL